MKNRILSIIGKGIFLLAALGFLICRYICPDSQTVTHLLVILILSIILNLLPRRCPQCRRLGLLLLGGDQHCIFCGHNPEPGKSHSKEKPDTFMPAKNCGTKPRLGAIWGKCLLIVALLAYILIIYIWPNKIAFGVSSIFVLLGAVQCDFLIRCPYCRMATLRLIPFKTTTEYCSRCGKKVEYKD